MLATPALPDTVSRETRNGPDRLHARLTLPVAPATAMNILEQPCHVRRWMPGLTALEVVARPAPGKTLVYMAHAGRWPVMPRDAVTLFERPVPASDQQDTIELTMQARPEALPAQPGHVRIPFIEGRWTLRSSANGTRLDYQQRVDPGGRLPQALADRAALRHVGNTMEALKDYVANLADDTCTRAAPGRVSDTDAVR